MNKQEKKQKGNYPNNPTLEDLIIANSRNGWLLQVYMKYFNKN